MSRITFSLSVSVIASTLAVAVMLAATSVSIAQDEDQGFLPEAMYGPMMGEEEVSTPEAGSAAEAIAAWALQPPVGPEGRPLPLTGSWMAEGIFGPARFVEMTENGHHVLLTFTDPNFIAAGAYLRKSRGGEERADAKFESYYKPALEYAREHKLPIAIRGWNWGARVADYEDLVAGEEVPLEQSARMILDGEKSKTVDPFGDIERWKAWGGFWFGNPIMKRIQEIYPDPPMVVFLNNNEGPKVRSPNQIPDDYPRMIAELGKQPESEMEKARAIRKGYERRYAALLESARRALVEPAWKDNVRFVAYNTLWDTGYIGSNNRPQPGIWFEPDEGWLYWRKYDGSMPELYDNDWQLGKTDHTPHSPQTEAMNYFSAQPRIFERDGDFYWSTIAWDGGKVGNVWRGRSRSSKTYHYVSRGQRWDFPRYEGWLQYTLWTTRARTFREFRGETPEENSFLQNAFDAVVRSVDRPWRHDTLREFWRFGELVPNPDESHPFALGEDQPQWVRNLERWYMLTCDANPPRERWGDRTPLNVFALALRLDESPNRRWLIYAHAPLGAVAEPTVTLPGFGEVKLDSVPQSGSFFLVTESEGTVEPLIVGGPMQVSVTADQNRVDTDEAVSFAGAVTHAPGFEPVRFLWDFGDGKRIEQRSLAAVEHAFAQPGEYLVTLTAENADGDTLREQTVVFAGVDAGGAYYHLSLDDAFDWEGPWLDSGEPEHSLVTYRHVPNRGAAPPAVLTGGEFVEDQERGRVLELAGEHAGLWLIRNQQTMMDRAGHPNLTISMWFKADATEGRQVLYAHGYEAAGVNLYLDGDTIYAGSWAPVDGSAHGWHPIYGYNFPGAWASHAGIEPGKWHHVAYVIEDATTTVADGKQKLYVDGELVDTAPGVRIPRSYGTPRVGRARLNLNNDAVLTKFHDDAGKKQAKPFHGRLD
ncbi:MAG: PKD domain-containing protein, partial [Phycisphaeraceae bacterium]